MKKILRIPPNNNGPNIKILNNFHDIGNLSASADRKIKTVPARLINRDFIKPSL